MTAWTRLDVLLSASAALLLPAAEANGDGLLTPQDSRG